MKTEDESQDKPKPVIIPEYPENWSEINKKIIEAYNIPTKHYTLKELADIYRVCVPTFKRKLAPYEHLIGEHSGRYYSITQVKLIFQYLDLPSNYTHTDLVLLYQVSSPTLNRWLEKFETYLGEKQGHFYSYRQLYIILTKLDIPSNTGKKQTDLFKLLQICNSI
jgi:hypothetical protein